MSANPNVTIESASGSGDSDAPPGADSFASEVIPNVAPSPLDGLAAKLAQKRETLHIDLPVPHWKDEMGFDVYVRYAPLSPAYATRISERFQKSKSDDWEIRANAQMLVNSCIGVFIVDPTEQDKKLSMRPGDPDGEWTKFDQDLGEMLGVGDANAIAVCRKLYWTDGDVSVASARLMAWSAQGEEESGDFQTP